MENLCRLGATFREAAEWAEPPELMVAPEAALTGYFLEGGVRDLAVSADRLFQDLTRQHAEAKAPPLDLAIGFYEVHQNRLYNSGLYATLGGPDAGIRHVHRKVFLPTYGVFDEERFVEAGRSVQAFDTCWGRAAILICEDAWHSFTPMLAALDGAQLIIIHDRHDRYIPYVESRRLAEAARSGVEVHYAEMDIFRHVDPRVPANPLTFLSDVTELLFQICRLMTRLS